MSVLAFRDSELGLKCFPASAFLTSHACMLLSGGHGTRNMNMEEVRPFFLILGRKDLFIWNILVRNSTHWFPFQVAPGPGLHQKLGPGLPCGWQIPKELGIFCYYWKHSNRKAHRKWNSQDLNQHTCCI